MASSKTKRQVANSLSCIFVTLLHFTLIEKVPNIIPKISLKIREQVMSSHGIPHFLHFLLKKMEGVLG